jgi:hypothetical protein
VSLSYVDVLGNANTAEVTVGGTTAPASGTQEAWTVVEHSADSPFPTTSTWQRFRIIDEIDIGNLVPHDALNPSGFEVCLILRNSSTSWTAIRGVDGTTPKAHAANWIAVITETAAALINVEPTLNAFQMGVR